MSFKPTLKQLNLIIYFPLSQEKIHLYLTTEHCFTTLWGITHFFNSLSFPPPSNFEEVKETLKIGAWIG